MLGVKLRNLNTVKFKEQKLTREELADLRLKFRNEQLLKSEKDWAAIVNLDLAAKTYNEINQFQKSKSKKPEPTEETKKITDN